MQTRRYLNVITKVFEVRKDYLAHVNATLRTLLEYKATAWNTVTSSEVGRSPLLILGSAHCCEFSAIFSTSHYVTCEKRFVKSYCSIIASSTISYSGWRKRPRNRHKATSRPRSLRVRFRVVAICVHYLILKQPELQADSAVEMLTDILTTLLDLLVTIPPIPDQYYPKSEQSDAFEVHQFLCPY